MKVQKLLRIYRATWASLWDDTSPRARSDPRVVWAIKFRPSDLPLVGATYVVRTLVEEHFNLGCTFHHGVRMLSLVAARWVRPGVHRQVVQVVAVVFRGLLGHDVEKLKGQWNPGNGNLFLGHKLSKAFLYVQPMTYDMR